jgi:hypothetical protein
MTTQSVPKGKSRGSSLRQLFESSGTEYCGDFNAVKFGASTNVDLWVFIASETELIVLLTPTFDDGTFFSMFGEAYLTGTMAAAFVAGVVFDDGSYGTIQGTAKGDRRTGAVASLSGDIYSIWRLQSRLFLGGEVQNDGAVFIVAYYTVDLPPNVTPLFV